MANPEHLKILQRERVGACRVFLCSTFDDLSDERAVVMEIIQQLQLEHDAMEFFGARPNQPIEVCLDEVRSSDLLVVIVGLRYGTLVPGRQVSFTQAEYEEGRRLRKPCLVYVRSESLPILPRFVETDPDKLRLLNRFKESLREQHTVAEFRGPDDLLAQVQTDLDRALAELGVAREAVLDDDLVEKWNSWRLENDQVQPDLSGAALAGLDLSGLNLSHADLRRIDFKESRLVGADLQGVALNEAELDRADARGIDLRGSNLTDTDFRGTDLSGADFTGSRFCNTTFGNTNLSDATGLENCEFDGASNLDLRTIANSWPLPASFLRGCGLPGQFVDYVPSLLGEPIAYYTVFISYSTGDEDFAQRLYADLQDNGVRCWFAPQDIKGGKKLHEQINQAIAIHDRLLLILSEHSMASNWVNAEVANARRRETEEGKRILFPIRLVDFEAIKQWRSFDADTGIDSARALREYFILDFSDWKNHDSYQRAFERLLRDLKADE